MRLGDCCKTNLHTYSDKEKWSLIRYLDTGSITEGRIDEIQTLYPGVDKIPSRARRKASVGDILFSTVRPNQKHYGIIEAGTENLLVSTGFTVVTVDTTIADPYFIYYYLTQSSVIESLQAIAEQSTSTYPSIKPSDIEDIELDLPELETQKKIGSTLRMLDRKIALNEEINDNLEQQAQAIYHERFETVSPNDLPSDWRIVTLGEVATISNKSFNPLKEPEILLEHYSIPAFDEARFPVFELSTSIKSNKFIIDASCFMISKLNPTTKRVWKPYCLTGNAVCSTEFIVYKAKDQSITDFLYSVIDSGSFSDFMCSHVTGSTGSRQRTTPSDTLSYELILPSEDELAEFQSLVSPMYAQMRINAIESDKLKRLRDSLLPKLMSGEIDVSSVHL
ncbi:restriction endonuclease subunit S [Waltera sp.]|uniref:restriction endonuclease subunit S n=1 Tax=Waltera sp. TaxID=2815806 RepID=UPI003AB920D8